MVVVGFVVGIGCVVDVVVAAVTHTAYGVVATGSFGMSVLCVFLTICMLVLTLLFVSIRCVLLLLFGHYVDIGAAVVTVAGVVCAVGVDGCAGVVVVGCVCVAVYYVVIVLCY